MKKSIIPNVVSLSIAAAGLLVSPSAIAGTAVPVAPAPPAAPPYEAGRGLLTLEGPTGMFINPTSATLPAGAFTAQACYLNPNWDDSVNGTGAVVAYGVTDWLELGVNANYIFTDNGDLSVVGPLARVRLLKDEGAIPQLSIGYYGKFGDDAVSTNSGFLAAYKRFPIGDEAGFFKSVGVHVGTRYSALDTQDIFVGYGGFELQMPYRLYLVGEVSTQDDDHDEVPYAAGIQWRAGGINISLAALQDGNFADGPGFYFGIGSQLSF